MVRSAALSRRIKVCVSLHWQYVCISRKLHMGYEVFEVKHLLLVVYLVVVLHATPAAWQGS